MHFDPDAMVFDLSNWYKIELCDKFSSVIFICLTPFSQLQFGLIGCMILMKEYISLTTAAMKMGKRHFYNDHSNGCLQEKKCFTSFLPVVGIIEI